jgi:beta-glucosidase
VVACAKHFVGDGGTEKGKNEGDTVASYEDLERTHMAPYLKCLAQGVSAVMPSYSRWNGRKLHADRFLLTEILKDKLGFKGCLVSDWAGIDKMGEPRGSNYRECVEAAINAGMDMVMVPYTYEKFINDLTSLVKSGEIPMSRIDDAVERVLRMKFTAGVFEHPFSDRSLLKFVGCKEHREIAREAVRKSLVLLKNGRDSQKPFLPLDRNAKKVLVAGTHADDLGFQCGGWTKTWQGMSGRTTIGTTVLDSVKAIVGDETEVVYEKSPSEETLASTDFSYAIVAVGEAPYAESRGDDPEPSIHFDGAEVMRLVAEKIPTVVILMTGRPVVLEPTVLEKVEALVAAWLPGTEGDGITDVVFGDYDFHGKLPVSWFRTTEQLPMNPEADGYDPLFPFGFGVKCKKE